MRVGTEGVGDRDLSKESGPRGKRKPLGETSQTGSRPRSAGVSLDDGPGHNGPAEDYLPTTNIKKKKKNDSYFLPDCPFVFLFG